MIDFIPLLACVLMAVGMGSNDTSNAIGICIGCGIITLKRAILGFGFFVLLGISLHGEQVMKTAGTGVVDVNLTILSVACIISSALILASNWKKIPLSLTHVLIGSLAGAGAASGASVHYGNLLNIVLAWIISPFVALVMANLLYRIMEHMLSSRSVFFIDRVLRPLLMLSGSLVAFNTGANELATVLGPAIHAQVIGRYEAFAVGTVFVFLGAYFLSYRVVATVSRGITALDPFSGFAAQAGAGLCILFFTTWGLPVSTTYCIVGAISGVGFVKGAETVRKTLLVKILRNWILGPTLGYGISFLIARYLR
jgi:PiT family inorganic phosphate transporter